MEWAALLGVETVPVLYRGPWDEKLIRSLYIANREPDPMEGYVVRLASGFPFSAFKTSMGKYVRPAHVTTTQHWRHAAIEANGLLG